MYGSRRMAKRSIVGTRVAAPWQDGIFYPGVIKDIKSRAGSETVYTIHFEDGYARTYRDVDIVGPCFQPVSKVHLKFNQTVFTTYNGREIAGVVQKHRKQTNEVLIVLKDEDETMIKVKLDDVRLLESRKSARLVSNDTDYSKLADISVAETKKRHVSSTIDVPSSPKAPKIDEEPTMEDVMAAMVLTSLSCSPGFRNGVGERCPSSPSSPARHSLSSSWSPATNTNAPPSSLGSSSSGRFSFDNTRWIPSPSASSNSDRESPQAATEKMAFDGGSRSLVEPAFGPPPQVFSLSLDEGIDVFDCGAEFEVEENTPPKKIKGSKKLYQCRWNNCTKVLCTRQGIEKHVRSVHLKRPLEDDESDDGEEDFYYTEIESTIDTVSEGFANMTTSSPPPTLSHMDMARPPHEDPNILVTPKLRTISMNAEPMPIHDRFSWQKSSQPAFKATSAPAEMTIHTHKLSLVNQRQQQHQAASPKTSDFHAPNRIRSDGRKCRKVYGMDNRHMWCTQCRWKKACTRFN
ncbi:zinc finger protein 704-like [Anneissia japonica]|uniref:zinc finger protein 704-like n=1 Tax=Anneissia japonica TaxID=1529436 RepID=UPI001425915D|nr:zinc finger protein 704-like [Anneissia japonica]